MSDDRGYLSAAREAMARHLLTRLSEIYGKAGVRFTLFRADGDAMVPWLRRTDGVSVELYDGPPMRYPRGVPVVGLAWERPRRCTLLQTGESGLSYDFLIESLHMSPELASVVSTEQSASRIREVLAIAISEGDDALVLCVESTTLGKFGSPSDDGESYDLDSEALLAEIQAFLSAAGRS